MRPACDVCGRRKPGRPARHGSDAWALQAQVDLELPAYVHPRCALRLLTVACVVGRGGRR